MGPRCCITQHLLQHRSGPSLPAEPKRLLPLALPCIVLPTSRLRGASFLVGSAQKGPRTSPAPWSRPAPVHSRTSVRGHTAQHPGLRPPQPQLGVGHGPASLGGTQQGCDTCSAHWGRPPAGPGASLPAAWGPAWARTPGIAFCGPHGSVCSPVTRHMKALLERNTKKKSKLRKKPKPYVEEPDGRASPQSPCALCLHSSALRPRPPGLLSLTASGLEGCWWVVLTTRLAGFCAARVRRSPKGLPWQATPALCLFSLWCSGQSPACTLGSRRGRA